MEMLSTWSRQGEEMQLRQEAAKTAYPNEFSRTTSPQNRRYQMRIPKRTTLTKVLFTLQWSRNEVKIEFRGKL